MATLAGTFADIERYPENASRTHRAVVIDRWIYVFTAATFIVVTLVGFIPDSLMKIAAVQAGTRAPFPPIMHIHAVLMGSFLVLLLVQTSLVATGKRALHRRLGISIVALAVAMILAGCILVPTMYHLVWNAAQTATADTRVKLQQLVLRRDNVMLMQLRIGILFPVLLAIGLRARGRDAGLHKRMMILATATCMPPAIDRIHWLPETFPASPMSSDLYTLLIICPLFFWDIMRTRTVHPAYLIWLGIALPFTVAVHGLWGSHWWYSIVPRLMGV